MELFPECRECGCSDDDGCMGGCYWVEPDLCSRCARPDELAGAVLSSGGPAYRSRLLPRRADQAVPFDGRQHARTSEDRVLSRLRL